MNEDTFKVEDLVTILEHFPDAMYVEETGDVWIPLTEHKFLKGVLFRTIRMVTVVRQHHSFAAYFLDADGDWCAGSLPFTREVTLPLPVLCDRVKAYTKNLKRRLRKAEPCDP